MNLWGGTFAKIEFTVKDTLALERQFEYRDKNIGKNFCFACLFLQ